MEMLLPKRRFAAFILCLILVGTVFAGTGTCFASREDIAAVSSGLNLELSSASAYLTEKTTGEVLYEQNADEHLEPASVTKIMSLLLIFEALDGGLITREDLVTASDKASSMGGSQIWLEVGEQMSVDEMIKAMVVVSANDCTVAMAEHLAGSEEAFVSRMNKRAAELGMENTSFVNCTGLPVENHYTTARDIATMTRELLKHEQIFDYTCIWMDSLRGGEMGLTNTNKLVRFYPGANGMKTGYTDSAKYCLSATAKRDELELVAVVLKAPSSDERFSDAKKLLDFGFANFSVYHTEAATLPEVRVTGSNSTVLPLAYDSESILIPKGRDKQIEKVITLPETLPAPIQKGAVVGSISYMLDGTETAKVDIVAAEDVERMTFGDVIMKMMKILKMK